jgi:hypothetical protein
MKNLAGAVVTLVVLTLSLSGAAFATSVTYISGDETASIDLESLPAVSGSVAYQGPVMSADDENWKAAHSYAGPSLRAIVEAAGGLAEGGTLGVVAADGFAKILPRAVVYGETAAGEAILALSVDGESGAWEDAPTLVFLPEDELFGNDDMLSAFGDELSHYFGDTPSTTGLLVRNVAYLVVNYDGSPIVLPDDEETAGDVASPEDVLLTVVKGDYTIEYTLAELQDLDVLSGEGTFTNSAGVDYSAAYRGVPMTTLIGNASSDLTVRVTASDGYSMNYEVGMLADTSVGTWILAFEENGELMPEDPGPLRIVQIGPDNPHFTSSLSARMVERLEVLGAYEEYALVVSGAVDRTFSRGELEAGVGCPCHTATVSVTSKGETHTYTGLPLWRLVAYVDDGVFPVEEEGIHYNDEDFNDALAAGDYEVELVAADGYSQTVLSSWIGRDDRFVVAFKKDGVFLDPENDGYMRFVFDDSVEFPEDASVKSVKFLAEIRLDL